MMMAVRNEAACDDVFIFPVDVFPETHGNGGKTKETRRRFQRVSEKTD
jgi:hypothetical protein